MPCDNFFEERGIPYEEDYQDAAVYAVWSADFSDDVSKKLLILCWFDTTFGRWNGSRFYLQDARAKMAQYLTQTPYSTFEQLLAASTLKTTTTTRRRTLNQ